MLGLKRRVAELTTALPAGYNLRTVRDSAEFIEASIHDVEQHLIIGSILAALVVLLFLNNLRSTIISAIAIPTSIIATFGLIWYMGFTLNMLTMLALTLSVGIVIDDAIVVLENIYRFIEEKKIDPYKAAIEATRSPAPPVSTLRNSSSASRNTKLDASPATLPNSAAITPANLPRFSELAASAATALVCITAPPTDGPCPACPSARARQTKGKRKSPRSGSGGHR